MRILKIISLLLLLGTIGCGMSEGQSAVLYLGSVTVQERRIETDARAIEDILEQGKNGTIDKTALLIAVKQAQKTAQTGKEVIEKLQIPDSTKDLHEIYLEMFDKNIAQFSLTEEILKGGDDSVISQKRKDLETIQAKITELDQKILDHKRDLSKKFQEVQLPEAAMRVVL